MYAKLLLMAALLYSSAAAFAQAHDAVWVMGQDNNSSTPLIEGNILTFSETGLSLGEDNLLMDLHSSTANICDASGQLLFYTNGCRIANRQHQLMDNGDDINPGTVHDIQCSWEDYPWRGAYTAGYQSCLILPQPGHDSLYYLFHKGIDYLQDTVQGLVVATRPLYYSLINMNAHGSLGRVELKNQTIIETDIQFGQLSAVRHANGQDWWVFTPGQENTNLYYRVLLSTSGLSEVWAQEIGIAHTQTGGWANFSPDGRLYARYNPANNDDLYLFEVDRQTGELSNFQFIPIDEGVPNFNSGVAFSPSSRFLYVSTALKIFQFDTWAEDIAGSGVVVAEYTPVSDFIPQYFWGLQLGPDCRLYVYCNSCDVIHLIHQPDEPGLACQFEQGAVELPWGIFRSQPHFPNYRLGPVGDEGLPCTPIVSVSGSPPLPLGPELRLAPNPSSGPTRLLANGVAIGPVHLRLYDTLGRLKSQWSATTQPDGSLDFPLALEALAPGLYWLQLQASSGERALVKFIKN